MALEQAEYRSKVRREKTKEAIALAMENRWKEAVAVNRSILELYPEDIEAYNRLGKALFELGDYAEARAAFTKSLQRARGNAIAKKNLERLALLKKEEQRPGTARKLSPQDFLEESGKAGVAVLEHTAGKEVLATITAGDAVNLHVVDRKLVAETSNGKYLGQIPPRLANRLIRLIQGGNRYEAAITRLSGDTVTAIIREVFQHPSQRGRVSFPSRGDQYRPYPPTAVLEASLADEEELDTSTDFERDVSGEVGEATPSLSFTDAAEDEDENEDEG